MISQDPVWFQDMTHCTLLKASKSKELLLCPDDSANVRSCYLIKTYYYPGLLTPIKYLFRKSKGLRELELAAEIGRRGIPTIVPEKIRDIRKWGFLQKSMTLTQQLPDCMDLEERLLKKGVQDRRLRRKIIAEYGRLARLIHDQGVYQDDFDPNNILYQKHSDGTFKLYFLDFERTRITRELSRPKRIHLLAKLSRMGRQMKGTDQLRFLKAYLGPETTQEEYQKWVGQIRQEAENIFLRDQRRAWKECITTNSRIGFIKYGAYRGYYRKKHHSRKYYTRSDIIGVIRAIEKKDPDQTLTEIPPDAPFFSLTVQLDKGADTFTVRFFQYRGLGYRLKRAIKRSPLLAAWKTDNGYLKNRAADFLPVAALEKDMGRNRYYGFLVRKGWSDA